MGGGGLHAVAGCMSILCTDESLLGLGLNKDSLSSFNTHHTLIMTNSMSRSVQGYVNAKMVTLR